jgi:hypothetical protein
MDATFELGLYTFGDLMPEAKAAKRSAHDRLGTWTAAATYRHALQLSFYSSAKGIEYGSW